MRVNLIWYTDPDVIRAVIAKFKVYIPTEKLKEHITYMFEIEEVSRVTTHQLIRHRLASYDQESQRFSAASRESFVFPPSIQSKPEAMKIYDNILRLASESFEKMVAIGVPKEDARYIMPHAIKTKLVMTLSAYSLQHIAELRTAPQAQWEIRELVTMMKEAAKKATPYIWS